MSLHSFYSYDVPQQEDLQTLVTAQYYCSQLVADLFPQHDTIVGNESVPVYGPVATFSRQIITRRNTSS